MRLVKKDEIKLKDLPKGSLFLDGETLCLKTEYRTTAGAIEAYIVGSGEFYWGGVSRPEAQLNLTVTQVDHQFLTPLKTSVEWEAKGLKTHGLIILDPDGWDRQNFQFSYREELITKEEFKKRAMISTIQCSDLNYFL